MQCTLAFTLFSPRLYFYLCITDWFTLCLCFCVRSWRFTGVIFQHNAKTVALSCSILCKISRKDLHVLTYFDAIQTVCQMSLESVFMLALWFRYSLLVHAFGMQAGFSVFEARLGCGDPRRLTPFRWPLWVNSALRQVMP